MQNAGRECFIFSACSFLKMPKTHLRISDILSHLTKEKFLFALLAVILAILLIRPILVMRDGKTERIAWLWIWSKIQVSFVNSVTGRLVEIKCYPLWKFSHFSARTDSETEAYYTGGKYQWNEVLKRERTSSLAYCSIKGVTICTPVECFSTREGCLSIKLLWP